MALSNYFAPPNRISLCRVLVVDDFMLDQYWYGDVDLMSPKVSVPVVDILHEESRLGGAANVPLDVKTLGGEVTLLSMVGQDYAARSLRQLLLSQGIDAELGEDRNMEAIVKLRVIGCSQK